MDFSFSIIPIIFLLPPPQIDRIKVQILVDDRFESKVLTSELSRKKLIKIYTGETIEYPLYPLLKQINDNFNVEIIHINNHNKTNDKKLPAFKYGRKPWESFPRNYFSGSCEFTLSFHHQLMMEKWHYFESMEEPEYCYKLNKEGHTTWELKKLEMPKYGEVWQYLVISNFYFSKK